MFDFPNKIIFKRILFIGFTKNKMFCVVITSNKMNKIENVSENYL